MTILSEEVSGKELERHLQRLAREIRLSGTQEESRAFDYAESELARFGYHIERFESEALIGYPEEASLEVLHPEYASILANGYSLSPSTDAEGVTGELAYAGQGDDLAYETVDVRGKIVLTDGLAMPGKALSAFRAGAVGHIHINDEHIHEMCISPVWGTPVPETSDLLPHVPAVGIRNADGERLKAMLERGSVRVRLKTKPYRQWTRIPTLTAELPGTEDDSFVLFSGHIDSWHYGVMDNGTANATQLEVARLLSERREELRRGIRLAFWSGHSHGRYAGSAWYADTFWHDLYERCVCHVNVDSVGAVGATVLEEAPTMAETFTFGRQIMRDTAQTDLTYRRMSRSSDQSFWGHGIPSLFASLSEQERDDSATGAAMAALLGSGGKGGGLGWWWHTTEDTLDKIDPEFFVRDAGIYAETLWQLCTRELLPFDPAAGAREIAETIANYDDAAGSAFNLSATAALAQEVASALSLFAESEIDATTRNRQVMAVCRLLIPVNYTRQGPFEQDLALSVPPVPGLSDARKIGVLDQTSSEFHFLRTKLVRERNRIEHALKSVMTMVNA